LPDDNEDEAMNYQWMRILQVLDQMEKHFHHLGLEKEDCRKQLICEVSSMSKSLLLAYEKNSEKSLEELVTEFRYYNINMHNVLLLCAFVHTDVLFLFKK
jgi:DNA-directed RNA polymerase subunit N (RpoN/RPB10)